MGKFIKKILFPTFPLFFFFFVIPVYSPFREYAGIYAITDTTYFIHQDHLGSVIAVSDEEGNLVEQTKYEAYGDAPSGASLYSSVGVDLPVDPPDGQTGRSVPTEKGYTSQIRDAITTLQYFNARFYDPVLSRFISADSAGGGNRFAYVGGNPVMRNDPSGNREEEGCIQQSKICELTNQQKESAVFMQRNNWDEKYNLINQPITELDKIQQSIESKFGVTIQYYPASEVYKSDEAKREAFNLLAKSFKRQPKELVKGIEFSFSGNPNYSSASYFLIDLTNSFSESTVAHELGHIFYQRAEVLWRSDPKKYPSYYSLMYDALYEDLKNSDFYKGEQMQKFLNDTFYQTDIREEFADYWVNYTMGINTRAPTTIKTTEDFQRELPHVYSFFTDIAKDLPGVMKKTQLKIIK